MTEKHLKIIIGMLVVILLCTLGLIIGQVVTYQSNKFNAENVQVQQSCVTDDDKNTVCVFKIK